MRYRWLLAGGTTGYGWVNGRGVFPHEVPGSDDYVLTVAPGAPDWHTGSVVYEIYPDRFASSGARRVAPDWAVPRPWNQLPEGRSRNTSASTFFACSGKFVASTAAMVSATGYSARFSSTL